MKPFLKIATLFSFFTFLVSCKDNGTNPDKTIKTPREMTWTADTLTSPDPSGGQLMMENILVFSTNDVWVCGWNDIARGLIWHYDGKQWRESNIAADVGGMRVNDIAGYNSSNLWTVGYSGDEIFIARYDGQHWTKQNNMGIKGELLDMSKDLDGNLWACGRNGVIMKYDKTKWIVDTIKVNKYEEAEYSVSSVEYFNNKIFVLANTSDSKRKRSVYYYIYGEINNWLIADSMVVDAPSSEIKWGNFGLFPIENKEFYSYGLSGIWKKSNEKWIKIFELPYEIYGMHGISPNYLIATGAFKNLFYYNGNTWESVNNLFPQTDPYFVFTNVWTNGYETFIIGRNFQGYPVKTIIFHGK